MTLADISMALLIAAAVVSIVTLLPGRPRRDYQGQLDQPVDEIRRKRQELPLRQESAGDKALVQASNEIRELREKHLGVRK